MASQDSDTVITPSPRSEEEESAKERILIVVSKGCKANATDRANVLTLLKIFPNLAREFYEEPRFHSSRRQSIYTPKRQSILSSFIDGGASLNQIKAVYDIFPDAITLQNEEGLCPIHVLVEKFTGPWNQSQNRLFTLARFLIQTEQPCCDKTLLEVAILTRIPGKIIDLIAEKAAKEGAARFTMTLNHRFPWSTVDVSKLRKIVPMMQEFSCTLQFLPLGAYHEEKEKNFYRTAEAIIRMNANADTKLKKVNFRVFSQHEIQTRNLLQQAVAVNNFEEVSCNFECCACFKMSRAISTGLASRKVPLRLLWLRGGIKWLPEDFVSMLSASNGARTILLEGTPYYSERNCHAIWSKITTSQWNQACLECLQIDDSSGMVIHEILRNLGCTRLKILRLSLESYRPTMDLTDDCLELLRKAKKLQHLTIPRGMNVTGTQAEFILALLENPLASLISCDIYVPTPEALDLEIVYISTLNRCGRKKIMGSKATIGDVRQALSLAEDHAGRKPFRPESILYSLLRENPALWCNSAASPSLLALETRKRSSEKYGGQHTTRRTRRRV